MSDTPVQITGTMNVPAQTPAPASAQMNVPAPAKAVVPDFVNVRLSAAGKKFAGDSGKIRIANAHMHYVFEGDTPQRVVYRGDWTRTLATTRVESECLFEIVPDATTVATTTKTAAASTSTAAPQTDSQTTAGTEPATTT